MATVKYLLLFMFFPSFLWAADAKQPVNCDTVAYQPDPSVEYQSGIDARGQAVAPADLPGSAGANAKDFAVPLTMGIPVEGYLNKSRRRAAAAQAKEQQENPSQPAPKPVDVNAYNADFSDTRVWPVQGVVTAKGVELYGVPEIAGPCPPPPAVVPKTMRDEDAEKLAKPKRNRHTEPFTTPLPANPLP